MKTRYLSVLAVCIKSCWFGKTEKITHLEGYFEAWEQGGESDCLSNGGLLGERVCVIPVSVFLSL